jgi:hypothetical protein
MAETFAPLSTLAWTTQVTSALLLKVGDEPTIAVSSRSFGDHSPPPLSRRLPSGQVTVASSVCPEGTFTLEPWTANA